MIMYNSGYERGEPGLRASEAAGWPPGKWRRCKSEGRRRKNYTENADAPLAKGTRFPPGWRAQSVGATGESLGRARDLSGAADGAV